MILQFTHWICKMWQINYLWPLCKRSFDKTSLNVYAWSETLQSVEGQCLYFLQLKMIILSNINDQIKMTKKSFSLALFPVSFTLTTQHYINVCFESLSFYAKMQCFPFYLLSDFKRLQDGSSKPQCTANVQSELWSLLRAGFCVFIFVCSGRFSFVSMSFVK